MRFLPSLLAACALTLPLGALAQAPAPAQAPTPAAPSTAPSGTPVPPWAVGALPSLAPLASHLLPSVVNISTSQNAPARNAQRDRDAPEMPQLPPGSPFEEFFRDFFNRNRPPGEG